MPIPMEAPDSALAINAAMAMAHTAGDTFLELTVLAAEDLKDVSLFGKMNPYAVVWMNPFVKRSTRILKKAGKDPVWNDSMSLPVDEFALSSPYACLTVKILNHATVREIVVGTAWLPLREVVRLRALRESDEDPEVITLQLYRPSGRVQGVVRISVRLVGPGFPLRSGVPFQQVQAQPRPRSIHSHPQPQIQAQQLEKPNDLSIAHLPSQTEYHSSWSSPPEPAPATDQHFSGQHEPAEGIPVMGYAFSNYAASNYSFPSQHPSTSSAVCPYSYQQVPFFSAPSPSAPPHSPPPQPVQIQRREGGNGVLLGLLGGVLGAILLGDLFF